MKHISPLSIHGWEIIYTNAKGEEDSTSIEKKDKDSAKVKFEDEYADHMGIIDMIPLTLADLI